ncbi:MAG: hypothetical protein AAFQ63_08975 [Cyanobacteria bacterium J06621_11]
MSSYPDGFNDWHPEEQEEWLASTGQQEEDSSDCYLVRSKSDKQCLVAMNPTPSFGEELDAMHFEADEIASVVEQLSSAGFSNVQYETVNWCLFM